ncbi:Hypothetical_protein [Hexamita inflata]|uniref:Hypothetical_protein n=1 Tax=Hexamita inflata TaxID=28002 RepID=A0AA86RGF8_9EUKA|nr:Hypothetical protein HINF_LOCUS61346 [Hexamita inflata]
MEIQTSQIRLTLVLRLRYRLDNGSQNTYLSPFQYIFQYQSCRFKNQDQFHMKSGISITIKQTNEGKQGVKRTISGIQLQYCIAFHNCVRSYQQLQYIQLNKIYHTQSTQTSIKRLLYELFKSYLSNNRTLSHANYRYLEFLELRSYLKYCKLTQLTLQTNYERQRFQMFRKTIYADNIYQNSDVCKFLEQCSLDFVMTFRKIRAMAEVTKIVGIFETNEFSKSEFPLFTVLQIQAEKDEIAQIDYSHGRQKLAKLKEITKSLLFLQKMVLIMSSNILQQIT